MDLSLVDSILHGSKVNLGFLIVQHMANVLSFANNTLPYSTLLTTIFQHFDLDLNSESDIRVYKTFDAIDIAPFLILDMSSTGTSRS